MQRASRSWRTAQATYRAGADFRGFIETEQTMARVVVHMLKLKS